MNNYQWPQELRQCWNKALTAYHAGNRQPATYFDPAEMAFLKSIGCSAQEIYDFAEDWCDGKEPAFETALLITSVRRDFFAVVQHGKPSTHVIVTADLPSKDAALAGHPWLPRVIAKARAKLKGELPDELMYGCGGDRRFFKSVNVHPADFLREVWAAKDDDQKIIEYVARCAAKPI